MAKHGKKYLASSQLFDKDTAYNIEEAVKLARQTSYVKFDASLEVAFRLNVNPKHADQQIRGAMVLPNGTGKTQKVCVITSSDQEQVALDAGADLVGGKELIDKIAKGFFEFDVIVATPNMMGELGKIGRILGPKGLMPNPKTGTVTTDIANAVADIKRGKVEYRVDKEGNISLMIGKLSFSDEQLVENFKAIYNVILKARPAAVKGKYMKNVTISATMAPGVKVSLL